MPEDVNQVQAGDTQVAEQPGTTESQVTPAPADVQPAAVTEPQKPEVVEKPAPERTYTHKEWQEREAARDTRENEYRQALAQAAMQAQIRDVAANERLAQAADAKAVESGQITETDAAQRAQQRFQTWQQQQNTQQERYSLAQQQALLGNASAQTEQGLRLLAAAEMAKEYGLDVAPLLKDTRTKTFEGMKVVALELKNKALSEELKTVKGTKETFDSGHTSGAASESYEQSLRARYPTMFKK